MWLCALFGYSALKYVTQTLKYYSVIKFFFPPLKPHFHIGNLMMVLEALQLP